MVGKRDSLEARFWSKVVKTSGCWKWLAGKSVAGYGRLRQGGQLPHITANRMSWQIHYGPIPEGMHVLHRCDNPECTNPEHLFLGTHADNMRDKEEKGRSGRDEKWLANVRSANMKHRKLHPNEEKTIRILYECGYAKRKLARVFGIDRTCINRIVSEKSTSHSVLL